MNETVSPAEQVTRVAMLLGRAVLRWKREHEKSSEILEFDSDSLVSRVQYDRIEGDLSISYHPTAIAALNHTDEEEDE